MSPLIQPLKLGALTLPDNLIQAPLAGYSNTAFRTLAHRYGQPAFACTEMISAQTIVHGGSKADYYLQRAEEEGLLCYQLSGTDATLLAKATDIACQRGADLIDLNCGCPVKKIRSRGAGSGLLQETERLSQLVRAMKQQTTAPISIKIRVAGDNDTQVGLSAARCAEDAGADFVVVHGRHWTDTYETPARFDRIARIVDALQIPVIGNGDVHDAQSLHALMTHTNCAGAMVARASTGQPWIFKALRAELAGAHFAYPTLKNIGDIFLEHIELLSQIDTPTRALLQARALGKYYARGAIVDPEFFCHLQKLTTWDDLQKLVARFFI